MKTLKIIFVITSALLTVACDSNKTFNSISGVYVMSFKNEYSIATDTIIIQTYNSDANTYQVERRDGYHRIRDGKILPKEFRQEQWMATFDKDKQVLREGEFGRQVYFKAGGRSLDYGGTYQKIK